VVEPEWLFSLFFVLPFFSCIIKSVFMKTTTFGTRLLVEDAESLVTPLPGQSFIIKLLEKVASAKYSIDVIQYQWNFYPGNPRSQIQKLNRTVLGKANTGTKIRVLLSKEGRGQHLTAINMTAKRFLGESGIEVKLGRTFPTTHAKLWVFDDDSVILGSHNLSNRSVTVNVESSVLIKSRKVAMEFKRYFDLSWGVV